MLQGWYLNSRDTRDMIRWCLPPRETSGQGLASWEGAWSDEGKGAPGRKAVPPAARQLRSHLPAPHVRGRVFLVGGPPGGVPGTAKREGEEKSITALGACRVRSAAGQTRAQKRRAWALGSHQCPTALSPARTAARGPLPAPATPTRCPGPVPPFPVRSGAPGGGGRGAGLNIVLRASQGRGGWGAPAPVYGPERGPALPRGVAMAVRRRA